MLGCRAESFGGAVRIGYVNVGPNNTVTQQYEGQLGCAGRQVYTYFEELGNRKTIPPRAEPRALCG